MAKKKKTQLKPVARGFATTSVPKKVTEVAEEPEVVPAPDAVLEELPQDTQDTALTVTSAIDQEEQSLQNLIDKFQEKTEKEITRTLKLIEQERRFSDSLPTLDLDSVFVERILQLALQTEDSGLGLNSIDEPEEKALCRLAVTYGVLRRLGFSDGRVEECLKAISGVDLDSAYDWLYLHCTEEELRSQKADEVTNTNTPATPRTPSLLQASGIPSGINTPSSSEKRTSSRLDALAPAFVPSNSSTLSLPDASRHPELEDDTRTNTPDTDTQDDNGFQDDDHVSEFVRLKMQIDDLTTHRKPGESRSAAFLRDLQKRLAEVQNDYLFDEKAAEVQYHVEREKADAIALQKRLRGESSDVPSPSREKSQRRPPTLQLKPSVVPDTPPDIFQEEDSPTGLFELLEGLPTTETAEDGTTVSIRDMSLPKHWSGRTPKALLSESVHKLDRLAAITYTSISGASRAKRAAVDIRWDGSKVNYWEMKDVACRDMSQAEQYIATVALHALTFPTMDGFAIGGNMTAATQTSFKLLPAVFRDLWDELENERRLAHDALNRGVWAKLRAIAETKINSNSRTSSKPTRTIEQRDAPTARKVNSSSDLTPEQIIAGFRTRQASSAYQEMARQRSQLPIAQYRDEIIATLETSQVMVLSGETGCGKSTQVPAFILEDQLSKGKNCKIYCTEPRRISAISLAQRVSRELGDAVGSQGSIVGYSIRLENTITSRTRLAFVTNGIALRMLEGGTGPDGQGKAFDEITHIVIDEVHERTIESDFLLIVLKSLLHERPDIKVVLMSATVDAEKISQYFGGCPVLYVPGRTFPVDVFYLEDAVELCQWKIGESSPYALRGRDKYSKTKARTEWSEDSVTVAGDDDDDDDEVTVMGEDVTLEKRYSSNTLSTMKLLDERVMPYELVIQLLERISFKEEAYMSYSSAILIFMPGMNEIRRLHDLLMEHSLFGSEAHFKVYPLHSMISSEHQSAVFDIPPPGVRKIVIATNIAETGITIPDITCVIDSGKHREMRFDEKRQLSRLVETFIAKSNAAQRRGRAGRVQSGICFHLFTKSRHETKMAHHPDPEMMRLSLSDLALRIKIMKINLGSSIEDALSRALDPPLSVNIQRAVSALVEVRALTPNEEITPMGRLLSKLPTDVHLGKFLLIAALFGCLDPALTIAATLNSKSPFLSPMGLEHEADRAKLSFRTENSDFLTIHNAFSSWRRASANGVAREFCRECYLSQQNLQQIEELRQQFLGYLVDSSFIRVSQDILRELSRARYSRGRTRFVTVPPELDRNSRNVAIVNAALGAGLYPKILAIDHIRGDMRTIMNNQAASFHPSSVNFRRKVRDFGVNYLCYFTLMHSKKLYAWETGPVDDLALLLLCGDPDFKLMSDSVFIDRKIRFRITPKASIALKILRNHIDSLLATQMRSKKLSEVQAMWNDIAMMVLGKEKPKETRDSVDNLTVVINRVMT